MSWDARHCEGFSTARASEPRQVTSPWHLINFVLRFPFFGAAHGGTSFVTTDEVGLELGSDKFNDGDPMPTPRMLATAKKISESTRTLVWVLGARRSCYVVWQSSWSVCFPNNWHARRNSTKIYLWRKLFTWSQNGSVESKLFLTYAQTTAKSRSKWVEPGVWLRVNKDILFFIIYEYSSSFNKK